MDILNDDGVTGRRLLAKWHPCNAKRIPFNMYFSFFIVDVAL